MTAKNLAPDTAREISGLKRRVSDLERMLDRARRATAATTAISLAPAVWIRGSGYSSAGLQTTAGAWRYYYPGNDIELTVADPTRHLTIDPEQFGSPWTIRVETAGLYELGMSVIFGGTASHHYVGIEQIGADAVPVDYHNIISATAPTSIAASLSGSRIVSAPAGSFWFPIMADDGGALTAHECRSFWARAVSFTAGVDGPSGSM